MPITRKHSTDFLDVKRTLAASIKHKLTQDKMSISEFAKKMGTGRPAVHRILDASNTSITLRTMEKASRVVGLRLKLEVEEMPPEELGKLAERLANAPSKQHARKLTEQIMGGFYGAHKSA